MSGRHLRNGLGAADSSGNNLSSVQEDLAVQRLKTLNFLGLMIHH